MKNKIILITRTFMFAVIALGLCGPSFAKLPVEKIEKDDVKYLFSADENPTESETVTDANDSFEEILNYVQKSQDENDSEHKLLSPKQILLQAKAEDKSEEAYLNRNHVEEIDPLLKEGCYLYNQDVSRERGQSILKGKSEKNAFDEKNKYEHGLSSSFSDITHNKKKAPKKKKDDADTIKEYKLKAQKLSELKEKENAKKNAEKDPTYKRQAGSLSESFK